jgi:hypothetical protein
MPVARTNVSFRGKAELAQPLLDPVSELGLWAGKNRAAIADARRRFDAGPAHRP